MTIFRWYRHRSSSRGRRTGWSTRSRWKPGRSGRVNGTGGWIRDDELSRDAEPHATDGGKSNPYVTGLLEAYIKGDNKKTFS